MSSVRRTYKLVHLILTCAISFAVCHAHNQIFREIETCLKGFAVSDERIVGRNDVKYSQLNFQWNLNAGTKMPLGYLLATTSKDVQAAVRCCKPKNVRIVAKGGGHSYEKYSFGDNRTLIVDLQLMDSITVEQRRKIIHMGPGVLIGQFAWTLYNEHRLLVPHGICPTVGMSGLALGGGYGYLSRLHGLTTDSIIELEMVDSTGSLLKVSKHNNQDIFFALRGAGLGSYGIVTRFTFIAYDTPEKVVWGKRSYALDAFPQVFSKWQQLLKSKPAREVNAKFSIAQSRIKVEVLDVSNTTRGSVRVRNILKPFPDGESNIASLKYPQFLYKQSNAKEIGIEHPPQLQNVSRHTLSPYFFKAKSFYVKKWISQADIWLLYQLLQEIPEKDVIQVEMQLLGGAIDDLARHETAFVHRGNIYQVQVLFFILPSPDALRKVESATSWLNHFFESTKLILGHTESYQNYADGDLQDYLRRYYGSNLNRLMHIKWKVDPDNYFQYPQSIPPSF